MCDSVRVRLTEDHTQHFWETSASFFFPPLEMIGLISKHENVHAVLMFTRGGGERGMRTFSSWV